MTNALINDRELILKELSLEAKKYLGEVFLFKKMDSTNDFLLNLVKTMQKKSKLASGSVVFADEQTKGRGRLGRVWYSPYGNIYCSLFWRFKNQDLPLSVISLVAAVLVLKALQKMGADSIHLTLKWPNDVFYQNKKISGILLESNEPFSIIIGIGINVVTAYQHNAIALKDIITEVHPLYVLRGLLINELLLGLASYEANGLPPFLKVWQQYDGLYNKKITIRLKNELFSGMMQGVTHQGELILVNKGNVKYFRYGEASIVID